MNFSDIVSLRLQNQHLSNPDFKTPAEVVSHLGAMQAQDFLAAKWGIGMRMENATDSMVEDAYNKGEILRTHMMRPTWHFVTPEDIRYMLTLTSDRVHRQNSYGGRMLELDEATIAKSQKLISDALVGKNLMRSEIKKILQDNGISTQGQRLAYMVMYAELDGLICSGPRVGKQFTYALLEERVPRYKILTREESLTKLVLKYFTSHGPAQATDFNWWSGIPTQEVKNVLEELKPKLVNEEVEGKTYWFSPDVNIKSQPPQAFLLSIYDEYTIAYKDRSALGNGDVYQRLLMMGNALTSVMIFDGKVIGTWKRELKKDSVLVKLSPFEKLNQVEKSVVEMAANRYGKFLGLKLFLQ